MTWVAVAIAGGAVVGAVASNKASKAQSKAAQQGIESQERMFQTQNELQEPFRQAGLTSQNRLLDYMGLGADPNAPDYGKYARDFSMQDFQADPGYAFRLKEGVKALERSAAARGLLQSGGTLRGAVNFGQEAASQEYQNAFNRYQINRANQLQPLQSLMGAGQTATNQLVGEAGNLGRGLAEGYAGIGNARASGYMGVANAAAGGAGQYGNYQMQQNYLNYLRGNQQQGVNTGMTGAQADVFYDMGGP